MKRLRLALLLCLFIALLSSLPAQADDPIIGEMKMWSSTLYIPPGWREADGQNMQSSLYPDLCLRLGSTYGSAPAGYCKLPDMRGRGAMGYHASQSEFNNIGETGGERTHTLTVTEMPAHSHPGNYLSNDGTQFYTGGLARPVLSTSGTRWPVVGGTNSEGGGQPHNVLDPYLTVYYIIYVGGIDYLTPTPTLMATNTPSPTPTSTLTPTPTITPTGTVTATATSVTTNTTYLPLVVTTTLQSGNTLSVPEQVSFGQIITSGIVISLIAVFVLDVVFRFVYRR